jgi:hypothetical protein
MKREDSRERNERMQPGPNNNRHTWNRAYNAERGRTYEE